MNTKKIISPINQGISISGDNNIVSIAGHDVNIHSSNSNVLLYELLEQIKRLNANIEKQNSLIDSIICQKLEGMSYGIQNNI